MKTNFFEHISALEFGGLLNIYLIKNATGRLTVTVHLPNETADKTSTIQPLTLKGEATELDERFFETIATPLAKTAAFFSNVEAYQRSLDKAKDLAKAEQEKKNKTNKGKSTTASAPETDDDDDNEETENLFSTQENEQKILAEKKKRYASVSEQVAELSKQFKYDEAITLLQTCADYLEKAGEINEKGAELLKRKAKYEEFLQDL
jgi:PRTRC genetic system protein E